jgi:hypothetical protein
MILNVEYEIKVYAKVDTVTGEVTDAFEDADNIQPTGKVFSDDFEATYSASDVGQQAREIAENNDWPAWRRG